MDLYFKDILEKKIQIGCFKEFGTVRKFPLLKNYLI